jgi:hypothetical protein
MSGQNTLTKLAEIIATSLISDDFTLNRKIYKNKRVRELVIANDNKAGSITVNSTNINCFF